MTEKNHQIIIIGGGPAALTAAIYTARANLAPLIFEGSQPGGQLIGTTQVENWPGNIRIMGPELMKNMRDHASHYGAQIVTADVSDINFSTTPFTITTATKSYTAQAIIVATGASPLRLECPGESTYWGKGVSTCAVCDGAFYKDKAVLVVGGGDSAMEAASFLTNYTRKITIVQTTEHLTASSIMQERVINNPGITILYTTTVTEIRGNAEHVTSVQVTNTKTHETKEFAVDGVFIAIGQKPNSQIFKDKLNLDSRGYIVTNQGSTATSVPGVFAAGDVHDFRYRQAITAAGSGCMAALDAQRYFQEKNSKSR